jgi:hypothetical protein
VTRFGWFRRSGAVLLALTFVLAVDASRAGLRPCPHHDQTPATAEHASHHSATDAGLGAAPAPEHDDGPCSCIAGAQCPTPAALAATGTPRFAATGTVQQVASIRLHHQAPARTPHLFLPEATAPPVVL